MIIDLFCGGGGASIALQSAIGRPVSLAEDSNAMALRVHKANHPSAVHVEADLKKLNPLDCAKPGEVDAIWASPPCVSFSCCRTTKPIDPEMTDLPWVVFEWAKALRPAHIFGENVERMRVWGPLENGAFVPSGKGREFRRWVAAFASIGYKLEWTILDACDYGAPTIRSRLFFMARRDGRRLRHPWPSFGPGRPSPHRAIRECVDWTLPILDKEGETRIFTGVSKHKVRRGIRTLIGRGIWSPPELNGLEAFLFSNFSSSAPRPMTSPLPTICRNNLFCLIFCEPSGRAAGYRLLTVPELKKAQGFPDDYDLATEKGLSQRHQQHCLGNSVSPPPAIHFIKANYGGANGQEEGQEA